MLELLALQAGVGDCLILKWGGPDEPKYLLIDGGAKGTYENHLGRTLTQLEIKRVELGILSHVDDDHIAGMLKLFQDLQLKKRQLSFGAFWHNTFSKLVGKRVDERLVTIVEEKHGRSYRQGSDLVTRAESLGIKINEEVPGGLVSVESRPEWLSFSGLDVRVIGPDEQALDYLRKDWEDWLEEAANPARGGQAPDRSPTNLSSIVVLARAEGKSLLLTGDADHKEIGRGLTAAGLLPDGGCLHVDLLKVPHHGSNRNVTPDFFETVTADVYVVSADADKNHNPAPETLEWLVDAAKKQKRTFKLYITNSPPEVQRFVRERPQDETYSLTILPAKDDYLKITLP